MTVGIASSSWGSRGAVSPPAGPGQSPGGGPGGKAPGSSSIPAVHSTKKVPPKPLSWYTVISVLHKNYNRKSSCKLKIKLECMFNLCMFKANCLGGSQACYFSKIEN